MIFRQWIAIVCCVTLLSIGTARPAHAYLGSFGPQDGYHVQSGLVSGDVTYYNAGQYGGNAGGGSGPTQIVADSGLWSYVGPAGGYFSNAVDRGNYIATAPPYPANPVTALGAYLVGGHSGGRTDNFTLAMRNDTPLGVTGPAVYECELDSYDFGGIAPVSVTSGVVQVGLYFCPNPGDTPNPGTAPRDKFTMSFVDSVGNIGFQWGYGRDNSVTWRTSPSNPWNVISMTADATNWDGVRFDVDLSSDTFSFDYYDVSANTWTSLVPSGTAMGQSMSDLTVLRWQLEDGLSACIGGKNFFDDFSFQVVPEPSSVTLASFACLAALGAYRRRDS